MMKIIFFCLGFYPVLLYSQLSGNCFINKSKDTFCFKEDSVILKYNYMNLLTPTIGEGTYTIEDKIINISFYKRRTDSSYYVITSHHESENPSTVIHCSLLNNPSTSEGVEWGIKRENRFIEFGYFDNTKKIELNNIDTLQCNDVIYIGIMSLNSIEIPINNSMSTVYEVYLSRKIKSIEPGNLKIRMHKKGTDYKLKILASKTYFGYRIKPFYAEPRSAKFSTSSLLKGRLYLPPAQRSMH